MFGRRVDLLRRARRRMEQHPGKYVDHIYGEFEAGGTSWLYISDVPFEECGFNIDVPHQPLLDSVKTFLGIVPMVLTIWPALFAGFHLLATRKEYPDEMMSDEKQERVNEETGN